MLDSLIIPPLQESPITRPSRIHYLIERGNSPTSTTCTPSRAAASWRPRAPPAGSTTPRSTEKGEEAELWSLDTYAG